MKTSTKTCLIILGGVLLFSKFFFDLSRAVTDGLQPNLANDAITHAWPFFSFAKSSVQSGILPLWNPYTSLGTPFFAEIGLGLFFPLSWLVLIADVPWALLLIQFMTVAAGMAAMYCYARFLNLEPLARFLCVALFAFAVFTETFYPTMGYSYCLMPAILWLCHRMMVQPDLRNACWVALAFALCFLGGFPNYFIYTVLVAGVYCAVLLVSSYPGIRFSGVARRGGMAVLVVLLMLGLVAVQLLPAYELSSLSYRSIESSDAYDARSFWENFSTGHLFRGFIQTDAGYLFGNSFIRIPSGIFYLGGTLLFLPCAFVRGRHRTVAIALVASLVALCLFIASYQVPALALLQKIPFASAIRVNGRAAGHVQFLLIMLAGTGLSALLAGARLPRAGTLEPLAVAARVFVVACALWLCYMAATVNDNGWFLVSFLACACLAVVAMLPASARSRRVGWLLALIVVVDIAAHREYRFQVPAFNPGEWALVEPAIEKTRPDPDHYRVVFMEQGPAEAARLANLGAKYQLPGIDAYLGLTSARWENYVRYMLGPDRFDELVSRSILQRFYGYFSRGLLEAVLREPRILELASLRYVVEAGSVREVGKPLPRAYAVGDYTVTRSEEETLAALGDPEWTPRESVVLEGSGPAFTAARSGGYPGKVHIAQYAPNEVVITADLHTPAMVVLTDAYYPGWEAFVDGSRAPVYRANSLFRAVEVPAGEHTVVFRYRPRSLLLGLVVTLSSALVVIVVALRRPRSPPL